MTLDSICKMITSTELLNALHACREGHPWNKTATRPWYKAWFLAAQRPAWEVSGAATDWLLSESKKRGE